MSDDLTIEQKREAYHLFHKVWGAASDREYHKPDWERFQYLIEKVIYVPPGMESESQRSPKVN